MATLTHPTHRHHHHPASVPPLMLGLVLIAATLAALIPFIIVLGGLRAGVSERSFDWILAMIGVFFVLFPLALRVLTPRHDRDHDREILEDHEGAHDRELRESSLIGRHL